MNKCIEPLSGCITEQHPKRDRNIILRNNPRPLCIIHIMMNIGDLVRKSYYLSFESRRIPTGSVIQDTIPDLPCEIQPFAVLLQYLCNPDALFIVGKAIRIHCIKSPLTCMSKGSMSQVMSKCDRFYKIFIQSQCLRYCSGNL